MQLGAAALELAMEKNSEATRAIAQTAYGVGGSVAVQLPHSRKQELEADHLGLIYMARAGYDPREAVAFWKRFAAFNEKQGGKPIVFLSTHPVDALRISTIEQELPQAQAEYERQRAGQGR